MSPRRLGARGPGKEPRSRTPRFNRSHVRGRLSDYRVMVAPRTEQASDSCRVPQKDGLRDGAEQLYHSVIRCGLHVRTAQTGRMHSSGADTALHVPGRPHLSAQRRKDGLRGCAHRWQPSASHVSDRTAVRQ